MSVIPIDLTDDPIAEETTQRISFTVVDEDGNGIGPASVDSLTLTLYNERDNEIINSRDAISILNVNGGVLNVDGTGYWTMDAEDNVIVSHSPKRSEEYHIALFEWTYSAGNRDGKQPVRLRVVNLQLVP